MKPMLNAATAALMVAGAPPLAAQPMEAGLHLKPATAAVKSGRSLRLSLVPCDVRVGRTGAPIAGQAAVRSGAGVVEDLLAPLPMKRLVCEGDEGYGEVLAPLVAAKTVQWQVVDGPGRISGDLQGATYQAPAGKPRPNKATVAATITYTAGRAKTILHARLTILDEVKTYEGTFSQQTVQVRDDYKTALAGNIRWTFEAYDEDSKQREYTGQGTAAFTVARKGCGEPMSFTDVPVEGELRVHDDGRYEFRLSLTGDQTQTRKCRRPELDKKLAWDEQAGPAGEGLHSGDPCSRSDVVPSSPDPMNLTMGRSASCNENLNRIQEGWAFRAVD